MNRRQVLLPLLFAAAFCLGAVTGLNLHRSPPPQTAHELAAWLAAKGMPVKVVYPSSACDPGMGVYLTTREDLPRFAGNVLLRYGDWAKWDGVVFVAREEGGGLPAPPLPESEINDPHFMKLGRFRLAGDPELLKAVAKVLR